MIPHRSSLCSRATATLSEEIKEIICKTLENLSEETTWQIILKLQSSGLKSKEDLKYVQQEDLADLLPAIQRRKLLDAFRSGDIWLVWRSPVGSIRLKPWQHEHN